MIEAIEAAVSTGRGIDQVLHGLTNDPAALLTPLRERIRSLAYSERYEEAAAVRDRAAALATTLAHQRISDLLRSGGEIIFVAQGSRMRVVEGRLAAVGPADALNPQDLPTPIVTDPDPASGPPTRDAADEMLCVGKWMSANATDIRLESVSGELAEPAGRITSFTPTGKQVDRRR